MCNTQLNMCQCNGGTACGPSATTCATDLFCCPGGCTCRLADPRNCGTCGHDVRPDLCCNGQDTKHDASNCAHCGDVCAIGSLCCPGSNGGWACVPSDAKNCGVCGMVCPTPDGGKMEQCCGCPGNQFCGEACPLINCVL
jgi:hypothetical protein